MIFSNVGGTVPVVGTPKQNSIFVADRGLLPRVRDRLQMTWTVLTIWFGGVDWAAWFSGVATLGAVVIALRLQRMYERRERPSLSAYCRKTSPLCLEYVPPRFATSENPDGSHAEERENCGIRIVIINLNEVAARDVEVRLADVHVDSDKDKQSRSSEWFKVSNLNSISINLVPRGFNQNSISHTCITNCQVMRHVSIYLQLNHLFGR